MEENLYEVYDCDHENILASKMDITNLLIFIKGYLNEYYIDPNVELYIKRMPRATVIENKE